MSVETIKSELSNLSAEERRELVAFLVQLNRQHSASENVRSLGEILDDQRQGQWLTLEEADRRLDWLPEPA